MLPRAEIALSGWGRYGSQRCQAVRLERRADPLQAIRAGDGPCLSRGLGRSYGDAAYDAQGSVLLHSRLDRVIAFDPEACTIECEAGLSLSRLNRIVMRHGCFPLVTPGTQYVSIGGCIAADVHGKNHHHVGSFSRCVRSFELIAADGQVHTCSREQNRELFEATVGGMGLTGTIHAARLELQPIRSGQMSVQYQRARNLDHAFELFASDVDHPYSVAWVDCLARGGSLGRSVLMQGRHAEPEALPRRMRKHPLSVKQRSGRRVPVNMPGFVLNRQTVKAFNALYYARHRDGERLVDAGEFFYPLDHLSDWNRLYGKRGFVQYQALLPSESAQEGMKLLLERIGASRVPAFLAVLKRMGPAGEGVLSFGRPGYTLALDLPNVGGALVELTRELDRIVLEHQGRLYLAKDALMERETFARMYPELERFQQIKRQVDPASRFVSAQARRLGIVEQP